MNQFSAQTVRGANPWLPALVYEQSQLLGLDPLELEEFVDEARKAGRLVAVVSPPPVRGYAAVWKDAESEESTSMGLLAHVLEGQPEVAYRALFSQALVQARNLAGRNSVALHGLSMAGATYQAAELFGADYGIVAYPQNSFSGDATLVTETVETVETVEVTDPVEPVVDTEAVEITPAEPAGGDLRALEAEASQEPPEEAVVASAEAGDPDSEVPTEDAPKFVCDVCGREFKNKGGLGAHKRVHE